MIISKWIQTIALDKIQDLKCIQFSERSQIKEHTLSHFYQIQKQTKLVYAIRSHYDSYFLVIGRR